MSIAAALSVAPWVFKYDLRIVCIFCGEHYPIAQLDPALGAHSLQRTVGSAKSDSYPREQSNSRVNLFFAIVNLLCEAGTQMTGHTNAGAYASGAFILDVVFEALLWSGLSVLFYVQTRMGRQVVRFGLNFGCAPKQMGRQEANVAWVRTAGTTEHMVSGAHAGKRPRIVVHRLHDCGWEILIWSFLVHNINISGSSQKGHLRS